MLEWNRHVDHRPTHTSDARAATSKHTQQMMVSAPLSRMTKSQPLLTGVAVRCVCYDATRECQVSVCVRLRAVPSEPQTPTEMPPREPHPTIVIPALTESRKASSPRQSASPRRAMLLVSTGRQRRNRYLRSYRRSSASAIAGPTLRALRAYASNPRKKSLSATCLAGSLSMQQRGYPP